MTENGPPTGHGLEGLVETLLALSPTGRVEHLVASGAVLDETWGGGAGNPAFFELAEAMRRRGRRAADRWLRLAIRASSMARLHGFEVVRCLSVGALRTIAALPEPERGDLLERIHREGLGRAAVTREARLVRTSLGQRRGRPALPSYQRSVRALGRLVVEVKGRLRDVERCAARSESQTLAMRRLANDLIGLGEELRLRLRPVGPRR